MGRVGSPRFPLQLQSADASRLLAMPINQGQGGGAVCFLTQRPEGIVDFNSRNRNGGKHGGSLARYRCSSVLIYSTGRRSVQHPMKRRAAPVNGPAGGTRNVVFIF